MSHSLAAQRLGWTFGFLSLLLRWRAGSGSAGTFLLLLDQVVDGFAGVEGRFLFLRNDLLESVDLFLIACVLLFLNFGRDVILANVEQAFKGHHHPIECHVGKRVEFFITWVLILFDPWALVASFHNFEFINLKSS